MYTYIFGYDNSSMTSHMLMVIRNTKMFVALATLYSCIPAPVILHVLTAFTTYIVIPRLSKMQICMWVPLSLGWTKLRVDLDYKVK